MAAVTGKRQSGLGKRRRNVSTPGKVKWREPAKNGVRQNFLPEPILIYRYRIEKITVPRCGYGKKRINVSSGRRLSKTIAPKN